MFLLFASQYSLVGLVIQLHGDMTLLYHFSRSMVSHFTTR